MDIIDIDSGAQNFITVHMVLVFVNNLQNISISNWQPDYELEILFTFSTLQHLILTWSGQLTACFFSEADNLRVDMTQFRFPTFLPKIILSINHPKRECLQISKIALINGHHFVLYTSQSQMIL